MARNLSRRRVLTHNDFMSFGGVPLVKKPARSRGKLPTKADVTRSRWATTATPAQLDREIDAVLYACPDGARCCDPACIAENSRRAKANVIR